MPSTPLAGRTIVISGAGSGIGRALAQRVARHRCPVAICDWDEAGLEETAAGIDTPVLTRKLDVRDRQGQMAWAAEVADWAPTPIGAVVNNAGVTVSQSVANASPEDDEWCFDVNFWGVVHGTRAFLPVLQRQDSGTLVNVSSVFGLFGFPMQSAYCASKHAVRGYTEALRHELRGTGVSAALVHPGGIRTNIVANARFREDDRGGTDHEAMKADFTKIARTSPESAAKTIQTGIEKGSARILIGPDAYLLAGLARFLPVRYFDVIKALEPLAGRR